jgi:diguanylate cyclase
VRSSVGLAIAAPGASAAQVLGDADAAMYRAKQAARGRHVIFDGRMREEAEARLRVQDELREALGAGQLRCHLQPVVALEDGRPVGVEALVRWAHPTRGLVLPDGFVGVAQEAGLMDLLGAEVLDLACAAFARLRRPGLHLAVNVSPSQLAVLDVVDTVARVLRRHGLDDEPGVLRLEVTESVFADRRQVTIEVLEGLRALGVTLVIDDFGTGFSSLSRLRSLPIDGLKIDRSFVSALGEAGDGDPAVITAVLDLAAAMALGVVAEGVETEGQRERLLGLGGTLGQGHLWAPALPPDEAAAWLAARG